MAVQRQLVVMVDNGNELLLGLGQRNLMKGRRNGPGGKIEPRDPSLEWRALLELHQECGVKGYKADLVRRGELTLLWKGRDGAVLLHIELIIFSLGYYKGEPRPTEEMVDHRWYPYDQLPYEEMFPADRYWVPYYLSGHPFRGSICLSKDGRILSAKLSEVEA